MTKTMEQLLADATRQMNEKEIQLAAMTGRLEGALLSELSGDDILINNLRARAWIKHDPSLALGRRGETLTGMPDGWPDSVSDPTQHVADFIRDRVEAGIATLTAPREPQEAPMPDSPSVRALKEMIG